MDMIDFTLGDLPGELPSLIKRVLHAARCARWSAAEATRRKLKYCYHPQYPLIPADHRLPNSTSTASIPPAPSPMAIVRLPSITLPEIDLVMDTASRCAALLLPQDAMAILPFHQEQDHAHVEFMDQDQSQDQGNAGREMHTPYSASFILDLATEVNEHVRNVIDFAFLPSFNNPTIAVLFQVQQAWTG